MLPYGSRCLVFVAALFLVSSTGCYLMASLYGGNQPIEGNLTASIKSMVTTIRHRTVAGSWLAAVGAVVLLMAVGWSLVDCPTITVRLTQDGVATAHSLCEGLPSTFTATKAEGLTGLGLFVSVAVSKGTCSPGSPAQDLVLPRSVISAASVE
jgi:drug/metabolite transporter superfamily protein YnfA